MQLFRNISRESMIFFTVLPAGLTKVPNDEWTEISARALGLPSPAQSKSLDNLLKNFAGMGAETWMGKLITPTTMQACNTLLGLMRKELGVIVARGHARLILARARSLHTQTARAAAGARGAPWFQRIGCSANGPEDAPTHADGAYCDDNWRSHNADRGARLGRATADDVCTDTAAAADAGASASAAATANTTATTTSAAAATTTTTAATAATSGTAAVTNTAAWQCSGQMPQPRPW
ncbi:hypothetical protein T492DRAFT_897033 [Pavlovales sp. CCMP2436]|nr:hypothetical protein T492DRAFT_897033 [Pavlovales sp. CCMP2436]